MKSNSQQPSLGLEGEYHRNSGLFADHFLDQRMPEMPEWNEASDWLESFNALRQLYAQAAPGLENANEPQTEEDFIKPVLRLL